MIIMSVNDLYEDIYRYLINIFKTKRYFEMKILFFRPDREEIEVYGYSKKKMNPKYVN